MIGNNLTGKLANFSARRRWPMLGAWVAVLVVAFMLAGSIGDVTGNDNQSNTGLESDIAVALIDERINVDDPAQEFVLVEFESGTSEDVFRRYA